MGGWDLPTIGRLGAVGKGTLLSELWLSAACRPTSRRHQLWSSSRSFSFTFTRFDGGLCSCGEVAVDGDDLAACVAREQFGWYRREGAVGEHAAGMQARGRGRARGTARHSSRAPVARPPAADSARSSSPRGALRRACQTGPRRPARPPRRGGSRGSRRGSRCCVQVHLGDAGPTGKPDPLQISIEVEHRRHCNTHRGLGSRGTPLRV